MWSPQEEEFDFDVAEDLGPLQFVKLHKEHTVVDDAWFCNLITVQGPRTSAEAVFPCYRWVQGEGILRLPEGTGEQAASYPGEVDRAGGVGGNRATMLATMGWGNRAKEEERERT